MPQIIIDGASYSFNPERDKRLLEFALANGVDIPYFCYHPALSVPTNCRMCLVEVGLAQRDRATGEILREDNGEPKLMWGRKPSTSCNQDLVPDMVVKTGRTSAVIKKAQEGVLEFMLSNHPLDCPICDQAGECPLQVQTFKYGPQGSRFEVGKVRKPKRIALGPRVTLDAERCINCTRCVRFAEEVSKSSQLEIINRGEKNFPAAAPGTAFTDPYSMNTIDLCPVGALTSTQFRFKARAWEMNYSPSVCTSCATGCNVDVWVRDNEVLRLTPRKNPEVNQFWMCDEGRLNIAKYNVGRAEGAKIRGDVPVEWQAGLELAAELLSAHRGRTLFIGSGRASLESLSALKSLANHLGATDLPFALHTAPGREDGFLRRDDLTPNSAGATLLGYNAMAPQDVVALATSGGFTLVYLLEDAELQTQLHGAFSGEMVIHAHTYAEGFSRAAVLFGAATEVEQPATFVNCQGKAQLTKQARQIRHMAPEDWMGMSKSRLDAAGQLTDRWRKAEHILDVMASWKLLARISELVGCPVAHGPSHHDYFMCLQQQHPDLLAGLSPKSKAPTESFKHSQFEFALDLRAYTHKV